jgi:nitronate monooxygenase
MFLVSGPELVVAACRNGVIGTFPALNQRSSAGYEAWLNEISESLSDRDAHFGVNLIVHRTNPRFDADLEITVRHRVPLVVTSLGARADVVDAVHSYGGLVFHDIATPAHASKAAKIGVDGLILVCGGAGGHAGALNPFALMNEVKQEFAGPIVLGGALTTGGDVAAAEMMGADFAYMGTRFLCTEESRAHAAHKRMIFGAGASDVLYTPAISGLAANFLIPSLLAAGLDPDNLGQHRAIDVAHEMNREVNAGTDVWSAGQGVGSIHDAPPVNSLICRMVQEYEAAACAFAAKWQSRAPLHAGVRL